MRRKRKIPDKPRYSTITRKAYQLLAELGISKFPVDPFEIIDELDNCYIAGWDDLRKTFNISDPYNLKQRGLDAETTIRRGTSDYLIVYDDTVTYLPRVRFTLAHEIGHIVLGHLTEFEGTSIQSGLPVSSKKVLETEADAFAAELLAPRTILRRFPGMKHDPNWLKDVCFLSGKAANIRADELKRHDFGYYRHEDSIHRNFYNYLEQCGVYHTPQRRLSEDAVAIPDELDDYISCEYWPYVAATVGMHEKNTIVQAAIENAVAFYDDEDMVLFVNDGEEKRIAEQGKDVILKCLANYAASPVKRIDVRIAERKQ